MNDITNWGELSSPQWINLINAICDGTQSEQDKALDELFALTYQKYEKLTDMTIAVLPLLIQKLMLESCNGRLGILDFCLAVLHSARSNEKEEILHRKSYSLILFAIPYIVPFLTTEEGEIATIVVDILRSLKKDADTVVDAIFNWMAKQVQATILLYALDLLIEILIYGKLTLLSEKRNQYLDIITRFEGQSEDRQIEARLNLLHVLLEKKALPKLEQIFKALLEVLLSNHILVYQFMQVYPFEARVLIYLDILRSIENEPKALVLCLELLLIELFPRKWRNISLLDRIWSEHNLHMEYVTTNDVSIPKSQDNKQLNVIQRQVLQKLIKIKHIWVIKTNLFKLFELPDTQQNLANFIRENPGKGTENRPKKE
jgi:hypothetical protein